MPLNTTFNKNQKALVTVEVLDTNGQIDATSPVAAASSNSAIMTIEPTTNPRQFYVVGQAPGSTAATFTSANGKVAQIFVDVQAAPDASAISVVSVAPPISKF